ncbi:unnamed protein product [Coffea canephora]|uniref:Gnk2-homologous domain-containing protein n=1 Tax=Coffea canephora TaxID=49390 RepID=A0A068U7Q2_COFCA|nr:unnamed protein product [Coffea canephora]
MTSSKLTISRCILYIAIFVERAAAVDLVELLAVDCRPSNNFIAVSKYQNELNIVLNYLQRATPATGFAFEYVGEAKTGSGIYGRALCRGDISATECKTCIDAAITELRQNCTFRKVAGAWYEGCFVKYSNQDIYSKLDRGRYYVWREQNVSSPASAKMVVEFLNHLSDKAVTSPKLFSKGEVKVTQSSETLYGLVQCALDISAADCKTCFSALMCLVARFSGKGGQFFSATCTLHYEFLPFF